MMNYIIQVILFQVLFLAIYDFFLSKETFFTKNRWYLISTPILSFLLPFIKIPTFQKAVPQEFIIYLPEIFLSPEKVIQLRKELAEHNNDDIFLKCETMGDIVRANIKFLLTKVFKPSLIY